MRNHIDFRSYESFFIKDATLNFSLNQIKFLTLEKQQISKVLEGRQIIAASFEDVGALLHIMSNSHDNNITFSLDPEDNNMNSEIHLKRYEPNILKGTKIGEDLFQADYLMKQIGLGTQVICYSPLKTAPLNLPQELVQAGLKNIFLYGENFTEGAGRLWFNLSDFEKLLKQDMSRDVNLTEIRINVSYQKMKVANDGKITYVDEISETNPLYLFAKNLTNVFNQSCKYFPEFKRMAEIYYSYIIAKFIHYNNIDYCKQWAKEKYTQNCLNDYNTKNLEEQIKSGIQNFKKGFLLNGTRVQNICLNYSKHQVQFCDSVPRVKGIRQFVVQPKSTLLLNGSRVVHKATVKNFNLNGGVVVDLKFNNNKNPIFKQMSVEVKQESKKKF
jgi:hypothetical protein